MVELQSRGLLFQGGIEAIAVIDLAHREVIARFYLEGTVHKMIISPGDQKKLFIVTRKKPQYNHYHCIDLVDEEYEIIRQKQPAVANVTSICVDPQNTN